MPDIVNIGTSANSGTGSPLRTAFAAINTEFARLAALIESLSGLSSLDGVPRVCEDIAEMIALPAPSGSITYGLVFVMDDVGDGTGQLASFEFDDTITATNTTNGEYVLTAGGGGFRRKGL